MINVRHISIFLLIADVETHYPGSCEAFERDYEPVKSDCGLYLIASMSSAEAEDLLDGLAGKGLDVDRYAAVADAWSGPLMENPDKILFTTKSGEQDELQYPPVWYACANTKN